jgi:uncharacterized protein (DUF1499 family)
MRLNILPALCLLIIATACNTAPAPKTLGLKQEKLAPCPDKPNCVGSMYPEDSAHYLAPWQLAVKGDVAMKKLQQILAETNKVAVQTAQDDYLHAVFTIPVFGFKDDVEFYLPSEGGLLHYRSASRVGHSDLGVNKRRMEKLAQMMAREGAITL